MPEHDPAIGLQPSALPELLSPGGSYEAACAALQYGADAVYAGLPVFSARADAANITPDEFAALIGHAHSMAPRRRVHVTLNTLVQDHEVPALLDALGAVRDLGADAVICQDFATALLARRNFPGLALHASTQLTAHNLHAAQALRGLGFSRVILAREVSPAEAGHIARHAGVEIEIFVHGALCYAWSGLCLCSSLTTSRSGNRGRCAYSCRQAVDGAHPFSMRDLCLLPLIPDIAKLPIASLKIEGRMKSPLYVAAVTDLYRRKLDGTLTPEEERQRLRNLRTIFSRPFTTLNAVENGPSPIDATATGHRGVEAGKILARFRDARGLPWLRAHVTMPLEKHDGLQVDPPGTGQPIGFPVSRIVVAGKDRVSAAAGGTVEIPLPEDAPLAAFNAGATLHCSSSQAVRRAYPLELPRVSSLPGLHEYGLEASLGETNVRLCARCGDGGQTVSTVIETRLSPASDFAQTLPAFQKAFSRTHPFPFRLGALRLDDPLHLFVPPSLLNTLRRGLLQKLQDARQSALQEKLLAEKKHWFPGARPAETRPAEAPRLVLKIPAARFTAPDDFPDAAEIVLQFHHDDFSAPLDGLPLLPNVRFALPLITRRHEEPAVDVFIQTQLRRGQRLWEVPDLASLHRLRGFAGGPGLDVTADWSFYALNRVACAQLRELGLTRRVCSPEDTLQNILALVAFPPAPEVLVFQHAPLFISEHAPQGSGAQNTVDRRHVKTLGAPYSAMEFHGELLARGVRFFRCDFSYSPRDAAFADIWRGLLSLRPPRPRHAGNLALHPLP
ncbi:MAG: U32 family peptidase [Kiritimatiellaeota bacterium]|nr:U32 family peptidase [Kiritimatiellota bacterium]